MRILLFFTVLLCSLFSAHAAEPLPSGHAPHPLTGSWSWTLPGKSCTEQLHYRANGTRQGSSGEETTKSSYEVTALPSLLAFYRLSETVTDSNGKRDCSGDLHNPTDEPVIRFIQFSPKKDQLIICREETLNACFGPLKRLPG